MNQDKEEKNTRVILVLGIVVAAVVGFVLSIFANMYYDLVLTGSRNLTDYNDFGIILPALVLVLAWAFLGFLIYDFRNKINVNRSFFKRFFDYYENIFWLSVFVNRAVKIIITVIKWFVAVLIFIAFLQTSGLIAASGWFLMVLVWLIVKNIYKRKF